MSCYTKYDLARLKRAYGSKEGDPNWDAFVDLDGDGRITWMDLSEMGLHMCPGEEEGLRLPWWVWILLIIGGILFLAWLVKR